MRLRREKRQLHTPARAIAAGEPDDRQADAGDGDLDQSTSPSRGSGPAPTTATSTSKIISSLRCPMVREGPALPQQRRLNITSGTRSCRAEAGRFLRLPGHREVLAGCPVRPGAAWPGAGSRTVLPRLRRCQAARMSAPAPVTAAKVVTAVNSVVATATRPMPMTGTETPR